MNRLKMWAQDTRPGRGMNDWLIRQWNTPLGRALASVGLRPHCRHVHIVFPDEEEFSLDRESLVSPMAGEVVTVTWGGAMPDGEKKQCRDCDKWTPYKDGYGWCDSSVIDNGFALSLTKADGGCSQEEEAGNVR